MARDRPRHSKCGIRGSRSTGQRLRPPVLVKDSEQWRSALDLMALGTLLAATDPERPKGITVFKSVGIAAQDWSLARLVVEQCEAEAENWSGHQELSHDHETG